MSLDRTIKQRLKKKLKGEEYFNTIKLILKFYKATSITKKYPGTSLKKIKIKCKNNHIKARIIANLVTNFNKKRKYICGDCFANDLRDDISKYQKIAKSYGGKLISKKYNVAHDIATWRCKFGHEWRTSFYSIANGTWCGECSSGLGERLTRIAFETIFKNKFEKERPDWLKSKKGNNLELDGYNLKLKLAFEHQGHQNFGHLKFFFNKSYKNSKHHKEYLENSKIKSNICKKLGILLIKIPEVPTITKIEDLKYLIARKLKRSKNKYIKKCISKIDQIKINYNTAYKFNHIITMRQKAKSYGGKMISKSFLGMKEKLKFRCKYNHPISINYNHLIYREQWCSNKKCKEETAIRKLFKRNPQFKKIIKSAKSSHQAKQLVAKAKDPNWMREANNPKTIRNHPILLKKLKKLLKQKKAKLLTKVIILQNKTELEIKCKRNTSPFNHPIYKTKVVNILTKKPPRWCNPCVRYEMHN